jgi:hypothetical protein
VDLASKGETNVAEGKRPGGLTALAVLNFIFGGLGVIGLLALWALLSAADVATKGEVTRAMGSSEGILWASLLLSLVSVALLIASGVGYLGQKRFLGRTLGTAYGVLSIIATVIGLVGGQEFGIGTIIGLVYPVLTLILLNSTFKDDLVN